MKQSASRLSKKIKKLSKKYVASKGVVLMYHRICHSYPDPWKLNVSESNFREHLKLFNRRYNALPLTKFNELRKIGRLPKRAIAITFDDGYADNVLRAAPLMQEAEIPATFFICTSTLGNVSGMWWDTLAQMVFGGYTLPASEKLEYENVLRSIFIRATKDGFKSSGEDMKDSAEGVKQIRLEDLYMRWWKKIQPMCSDKQKSQLEFYRQQLNFEQANIHPMMQDGDVRNLSGYNLFEIGAHTQSHIQLSAHNFELQELEIQENIKYLSELTGQPVRSMSYPFGSYDLNTLAITKKAGFEVACTTVAEVATKSDDSLLLPRVTVYDLSADSLQSDIERYF